VKSKSEGKNSNESLQRFNSRSIKVSFARKVLPTRNLKKPPASENDVGVFHTGYCSLSERRNFFNESSEKTAP